MRLTVPKVGPLRKWVFELFGPGLSDTGGGYPFLKKQCIVSGQFLIGYPDTVCTLNPSTGDFSTTIASWSQIDLYLLATRALVYPTTLHQLERSLAHHGIQRPAEPSGHAQSVYFRYAIHLETSYSLLTNLFRPRDRGQMYLPSSTNIKTISPSAHYSAF
jgi:hypothetical protein